jgi:hypothetical protein
MNTRSEGRLSGEETAGVPASSVVRGIKNVAAVAGPLVVALTLAYDTFYDPLGTSTEEVGRTVASMLILPVAFLSALGALVAVAIYCGVLYHRSGTPKSLGERALSIVGAICLAYTLTWLLLLGVASVRWLMPLVSVAGVVTFLALFGAPASVLRREQLRLTRSWLVVVALVGVITIWTVVLMQAEGAQPST